MGKFDDTDDDKGFRPTPEDDPYAELFADCKTAEDVVQLQKEIDAAEASGQ